MTKSTQIRITSAFLLIAIGCEPSTTSTAALTEAVPPDTEEYSPLAVEGTINDITVAGQPRLFTGAIDTEVFEYTLLAMCADQIANSDDAISQEACSAFIDVPVDPCLEWFCGQQLFLCMGHLAMEAAETVSFFENEGILLDLQWDAADEEWELINELDWKAIADERIRTASEVTGSSFEIKIPQQAAEDKTILYRLGMKGFWQSGIFGSQLLIENEPGPEGSDIYIPPVYTCMDQIFDETLPTIINQHGEEVSAADLFSVSFTEAVFNYSEAARDTVQNTTAVADSQFSMERNFSKASKLAWVGVNDTAVPKNLALENSRMATMLAFGGGLEDGSATAVGLFDLSGTDPEIVPANIVLPCLEVVDRDSTQNALTLLRGTRIHGGIADESSMSDSDVVADLQDALAADMSMDSLSSSSMSASEFMSLGGFTLADIGSARQYLREEKSAFGRPVVLDDTHDSGVPRINGLSHKPKQMPGAFFAGKIASLKSQDHGVEYACTVDTLSNDLECDYAGSGSANALEYFRWASESALVNYFDQTLGASGGYEYSDEEHALFFRQARAVAKMEGGDMLVEYEIFADANVRVEISVFGLEDDETVIPVYGDEGYYCYTEASIDGEPCIAKDYVLDSVVTLDIDDAHFYGKNKALFTVNNTDTSAISFLNLDLVGTAHGVLDGVPIYLFVTAEGASPELVAVVTPTPPSRHVFLPAGSSMVDELGTAMAKNKEFCAKPDNTCAGLPKDLVPPLENELTSDSDPYENSWRHYLDLARLKAERADMLGNQLVAEGLDMDLRAEGAMDELEAICGEVTVEGYEAIDWLEGSENGDVGLGSCTGGDVCTAVEIEADTTGKCDRYDYVALGANESVCILFNEDTMKYCDIEISDLGLHRGIRCPYRKSGSSCADTVRNEFALSSTVCDEHDTASGCKYRAILIKTGLELFQGDNDTDEVSETKDPDRAKVYTASNLSRLLTAVQLQADFGERYRLRFLGSEDSILDIHYYSETELNPTDTAHAEYPIFKELLWGWPYKIGEDSKIDYSDKYNFSSPEDRRVLAERIRVLLKRIGWLLIQTPNIEYVQNYSGNNGCKVGGMGGGEPGYSIYKAGDDDMYRCLFTPESGVINGWQTVKNHGYCFDTDDDNYAFGKEYPCCGLREDGTCELISDGFGLENPAMQVISSICGTIQWIPTKEHIIRCGKSYSTETASFNAELFREAVLAALDGKNQEVVNRFIDMKEAVQAEKHPETIAGYDVIDPGNYENIFSNASLSSYGADEEIRWITFATDMFIRGLDKKAKTAVYDCVNLLDTDLLGEIDNVEDMSKLSAYMACAGDQIRANASTIVIPNLPVSVVDSIQTGGMLTDYPGVRGAYLNQLNIVESNILAFERLSNDLSNVLYQMSTTVALAQQQLRLAEIRGQIETLHMEKDIVLTVGQLVQTIFNAMASMTSAYFWDSASSGMQAAGYLAFAASLGIAISIDQQIIDLIDEATDTEMKIIVQENLKQLSTLIADLKNSYIAVKDTYLYIVNGVNDLDSLQHSAEKALAKSSFAGSDDSGKVFYVNNTMRKRYNTTQVRYTRAFEDATKMAYVARSAIEFRLGIDLSEITFATLEDPPSTWAESVCKMQGIEYANVRDDVGTDPEIANYADAYIGDYITKLENYVESYSFDNPFSEADDLAVISLKNDLLIPYGPCDSREGPNLLYFSEELGSSQFVTSVDETETWINGWEIAGCTVLDPDTCTEYCEDICLEVNNNRTTCGDTSGTNIVCDDVQLAAALGEYYSRADLLRDIPADCDDADPYCPRIEGAPNSGFIRQKVNQLDNGVFLLSWKDMFPLVDTAATYSTEYGSAYEVILSSEDYPFTVADETGSVICSAVTACSVDISSSGSYETWAERDLFVENPDAQDIELQVHPSTASGLEYGMVWLVEWQLERLKTEEIPTTAVSSPEYFLTMESLEYQPWGCSNPGGDTMRSFFTFKCPNNDLDDTDCYYETSFDISLEQIESGVILNNHAIALDNYNYRHSSVALNLVGSNVRDCTLSDSPSSCYSNGYLPYTVMQDGHVSVRNHEMKQMEYTLPVAKIHYGKALAAEVVLTNPLSGSGSSLIAPYVNNELRGRPLQGTYTIRIYNVPELMWANVDDIQLMWNYHYWTKFGE